MMKTLHWILYGRGFFNVLAWVLIFISLAALLVALVACDAYYSCKSGAWCVWPAQ
jgi:hypothetical protein